MSLKKLCGSWYSTLFGGCAMFLVGYSIQSTFGKEYWQYTWLNVLPSVAFLLLGLVRVFHILWRKKDYILFQIPAHDADLLGSFGVLVGLGLILDSKFYPINRFSWYLGIFIVIVAGGRLVLVFLIRAVVSIFRKSKEKKESDHL